MVHGISWHDLEFERAPLRFHSTCGVPQTAWVPVGMPKIPQRIVDSVFYLYNSAEDAAQGKDPKGTGFVVEYHGPARWEGFGGPRHYYGVTNWHVSCRGASVIRLNKKEGGTDIVDLAPHDWFFIGSKYDVAVVPLTLDDTVHEVSAVHTHSFCEPEWPHRRFAVGDDAFMIGLFVDHAGAGKNIPSARFGHISMLPNADALIKQPTSYMGESFVIDMHSRSGFSGSPVFMYRTFAGDLTNDSWGHEFRADNIKANRDLTTLTGRIRGNTVLQFLGIHWGQFPEAWELRGGAAAPGEARRDLITEGGYVHGLSGMTCVVPAWHVMEVLELPKLHAMREAINAGITTAVTVPTPEAT